VALACALAGAGTAEAGKGARGINGLRTTQERFLAAAGFEGFAQALWRADVLNPEDADPGYLPQSGVKPLRFAGTGARPDRAPSPLPGNGKPDASGDENTGPEPLNPFPSEEAEGGGQAEASEPEVLPLPFSEDEGDGSPFRVSSGPPVDTDPVEVYQPYKGNYGFVDPEEFLILFERQVTLPDGTTETAKVPFSIPYSQSGSTRDKPVPSTATYERP
jgi:hypothetical protein